MPEDLMHTHPRTAPVSDVCLPQCIVIPPTKFREESIMWQHLCCSSSFNSVLERQNKITYSIKSYYPYSIKSILLLVVAYCCNSVEVFSGMGRGTAESKELLPECTSQNLLILSCSLAHLQNEHLQNYICFLRFVYPKKRKS